MANVRLFGAVFFLGVSVWVCGATVRLLLAPARIRLERRRACHCCGRARCDKFDISGSRGVLVCRRCFMNSVRSSRAA